MARVKTTKQYIRECAYCVLVAPIGRVTTDDIIHHRLLETLRRPGGRKMLVTTKIDVSLNQKHQDKLILTGQDLSPDTNPQKVAVNTQSIEEFRRLSNAQSRVIRVLKNLGPSVGIEAKMELEEKRAMLGLVTNPTGTISVLTIISFKKKAFAMLYGCHRTSNSVKRKAY